MKTTKVLFLALAAAFSVLCTKVSSAQTGVWIDTLSVAKDYAFSTGTPLVMVWSNDICDHCQAFKASLRNAEFTKWQSAQPYVFCLVEGKSGVDSSANKGAKGFAKNAGGYGKTNTGGYPMVSLLWLEDDKVKAVSTFTGRPGKMGVPKQDEMYKEFIAAIEKTFADYSPEPEFLGGKFTVGKAVGDRLEAEESTEWVDVPIKREGTTSLVAAEERLTIVYPTGASASAATALAVIWADGESEKYVRVAFADLPGFSFVVSGAVGLTLSTPDGKILDESLIALVNRGNSPKNPVWVGRKTADELAWGEWTMDLEEAKKKVSAAKAKSENAYLLVSFGGSVWCPDCAKTERYLVDTDEFKTWASARQVACVAIDIPNVNATVESQTGPCLLTREKKTASATYMAADPDGGAVQSGAGYLSRWMVSDKDAEAVLNRNLQLLGTNTKNGGWNRPERTNQYRTGVPVFALVDADTLKVVSRIELFASSSPTDASALAGHIRRFDELLAVETAIDAAFEEDNRDISTTTAEIAADGAAADGEVSGGDLVDMFAVTGVEFDKRTTLTATTKANVEWKLSLVQAGANGTNVVATSTGTGNIAVSADLDEANGTDIYAKVELTALGSTAASFGADVDATVSYSLSAENVVTPGTVAFDAARAEAFIPNGNEFSVAVSRTGGRTGAVKARVFLKDAGGAAEYAFEEANLVWAAGETGAKLVSFEAWRPDDRLASGSFTLGLELVDGGDSLGMDSCKVTLADTTAPSFASFNIETGAHLTFTAAESLALMNVKAGTAATLKKTSGSLPKGMSLSYDRKTGTVTLKGTPKTAGTYTATYTVTQNKVTGLPATITITVDDPKAVNPFLGVKRAEQTRPLVEEVAEGTNVVVGTISVSMTAANKLKVKLQTIDGVSTSFSGGWTNFDSATGVASVTFVDRKGVTVALEMDAEGTIFADVGNGQYVGEIAAASDTNFKDWVGSYTVTFPENPSEYGDASMAFATMTIAANGTVKWSATLSNAQTASGSAQLFDRDGDVAYVALFKSAKKYAFSSLLKVKRGGGATWNDQAANQIIHNAADMATFESIEGMDSLRAAFGGWWTPNAAPTDLLAVFEYSNELTLESEAFDDRDVIATAKGFTLDAVVRGDKLSFTKKTGAFSGNISIPGIDGKTIKATIKGVLLPGWDDCGCVEPGEGEDALVTRPFGAGIVSYRYKSGSAVKTASYPVYLRAFDLAE